jgi:hypothetical protein
LASEFFNHPGLLFTIYALRNGCGKKIPRDEKCCVPTQVGEYVTRQARRSGRDFGGLKAGFDGMEFSKDSLVERQGKNCFSTPEKRFNL